MEIDGGFDFGDDSAFPTSNDKLTFDVPLTEIKEDTEPDNAADDEEWFDQIPEAQVIEEILEEDEDEQADDDAQPIGGFDVGDEFNALAPEMDGIVCAVVNVVRSSAEDHFTLSKRADISEDHVRRSKFSTSFIKCVQHYLPSIPSDSPLLPMVWACVALTTMCWAQPVVASPKKPKVVDVVPEEAEEVEP